MIFTELIESLQGWTDKLKNERKYKLIKMDIKELYPSVDPKVAVDRMIDCIKTNGSLKELLEDLKINEITLIEDLNNCIKEGIITCGNSFYKQIKGLPIGSPISGLLSNFYLFPLLSKFDILMKEIDGNYIRYVDDFLFLVPNNTNEDSFLEMCNSFDQLLDFTIESKSNPMSFLQINIRYDSTGTNIYWFRKKQIGRDFLHYKSSTALSAKRANVLNLLRLFDYITEFNTKNYQYDEKDSNWKELRDILIHNGYPIWLIKKWKDEYELKTLEKTTPQNRLIRKGMSFQEFKNIIKEGNVKVPGDGHCFLHSVAAVKRIRVEKLKSELKNFLMQNSSKFSDFLPNNWHHHLLNYCDRKIWSNDFGDIVPAIVADMTKTKILIFNNVEDKLNWTILNDNMHETIYLLLEERHYTAVDHVFSKNLKLEEVSTVKGVKNLTDLGFAKSNYIKPNITLKFKSDSASKQIQDFKKTLKIGDEFNIVYKSNSRLCDIVNNIKNKDSVSNSRIPTNIPLTKDDTKNVYGAVYQATCLICRCKNIHSTYIGETKRCLYERVLEHCRKIKEGDPYPSAIASHFLSAHGDQPSINNVEFKLLLQCNRTQDRRALEALKIRSMKPNLNRDEGIALFKESV